MTTIYTYNLLILKYIDNKSLYNISILCEYSRKLVKNQIRIRLEKYKRDMIKKLFNKLIEYNPPYVSETPIYDTGYCRITSIRSLKTLEDKYINQVYDMIKENSDKTKNKDMINNIFYECVLNDETYYIIYEDSKVYMEKYYFLCGIEYYYGIVDKYVMNWLNEYMKIMRY